MKYKQYAEELKQLLDEDQEEWRRGGQSYFQGSDDTSLNSNLKRNIKKRTNRMLAILDEIGEPSISNIGIDGSQAVSVLALHSSLDVLKRVLTEFVSLYEKDEKDTYYQAIPSMTDRILLSEHKPQQFGTQWMIDKNNQPFLPPVEDFERVNDLRAEYGIVEPLSWPTSLAVPISKQPWLKKPLTKLTMREPTNEELERYLR